MFTDQDYKAWSPLTEIQQYVASLVEDGAKVLEIGASSAPFIRSTHFIDINPGENVTVCDVVREKLPFPAKFFDFVYSRHVVEDLLYPFLFLDEMSRVAKAGYIETPSPVAELCRGIDGGSPPWRGYQHHHWFVSDNNGILTLTKKFPIVEHTTLGNEEMIEGLLKEYPLYWNTYFLWQDQIKWKEVIPYSFTRDLPGILIDAVSHSIESANQFVAVVKGSKRLDRV